MVASSEFLADVARAKKGTGYLDGPMVYHNFLSTSLIRRLSRNGVFFRRSSPDLYSAVAVAANVPRFLSTQEILTISGQGAKANGAAVQSGRGADFMGEVEVLYPSRYGVRAVQMHLLDALTEVAEHFKRPDLLSDVRYADHVIATVRESFGLASGARLPEIRAAFAAAKRHRVTTRAVIGLPAGLWPRSRPPRSADHAFEQHDIVQLPASVSNIYDASHAVDELLTKARMRSRRAAPQPRVAPAAQIASD